MRFFISFLLLSLSLSTRASVFFENNRLYLFSDKKVLPVSVYQQLQEIDHLPINSVFRTFATTANTIYFSGTTFARNAFGGVSYASHPDHIYSLNTSDHTINKLPVDCSDMYRVSSLTTIDNSANLYIAYQTPIPDSFENHLVRYNTSNHELASIDIPKVGYIKDMLMSPDQQILYLFIVGNYSYDGRDAMIYAIDAVHNRIVRKVNLGRYERIDEYLETTADRHLHEMIISPGGDQLYIMLSADSHNSKLVKLNTKTWQTLSTELLPGSATVLLSKQGDRLYIAHSLDQSYQKTSPFSGIAVSVVNAETLSTLNLHKVYVNDVSHVAKLPLNAISLALSTDDSSLFVQLEQILPVRDHRLVRKIFIQ